MAKYVILSPIFTVKYGTPAWVINKERFPTINFEKAGRFDSEADARSQMRTKHDRIMTIEDAQELIDNFVNPGALYGYAHGSISTKDLQGR